MSSICNWWDVMLFLVFSIIHIGSWTEAKKTLDADPLDDQGQRELGATSMANASVAGITAVSILISASLLIVQIAFEHSSAFPHQALEYIFRGSAWFLLSLLFGLYLIYRIPMLSPKHNVARRLEPDAKIYRTCA